VVVVVVVVGAGAEATKHWRCPGAAGEGVHGAVRFRFFLEACEVLPCMQEQGDKVSTSIRKRLNVPCKVMHKPRACRSSRQRHSCGSMLAGIVTKRGHQGLLNPIIHSTSLSSLPTYLGVRSAHYIEDLQGASWDAEACNNPLRSNLSKPSANQIAEQLDGCWSVVDITSASVYPLAHLRLYDVLVVFDMYNTRTSACYRVTSTSAAMGIINGNQCLR
jgi:hypothetical protein